MLNSVMVPLRCNDASSGMLESQIRMLESKICIGGDAMSELRKEWTPEQVQEHRAEANESLPEARTTDRFPVAGRASGMDRWGGEGWKGGEAEGTVGGVRSCTRKTLSRPPSQAANCGCHRTRRDAPRIRAVSDG